MNEYRRTAVADIDCIDSLFYELSALIDSIAD